MGQGRRRPPHPGRLAANAARLANAVPFEYSGISASPTNAPIPNIKRAIFCARCVGLGRAERDHDDRQWHPSERSDATRRFSALSLPRFGTMS